MIRERVVLSAVLIGRPSLLTDPNCAEDIQVSPENQQKRSRRRDQETMSKVESTALYSTAPDTLLHSSSALFRAHQSRDFITHGFGKSRQPASPNYCHSPGSSGVSPAQKTAGSTARVNISSHFVVWIITESSSPKPRGRLNFPFQCDYGSPRYKGKPSYSEPRYRRPLNYVGLA